MKIHANRFLSAVIILSLVFALSAVPVYAEDPTVWDGETVDYSWYNWQDTEFTITTAAQLAGLAYITGYPDATYGAELIHGKQANHFRGETIKLGADIDLGGHPWLSICCNPAYPFLGTFDGNGHTIKNLYNDTTNNLQNKNKTLGTSYPKFHFGLFGYMLGTVKNLCIDGAMWDFELSESFGYPSICGGGIAAVLGTLFTVTDFGGENTVPAPEDYSPRIENCCVKNITYNLSNTAEAEGYSTVASLGGLVGAMRVGSVEGCYVNGIGYTFGSKIPSYYSTFANIIGYKGLDTDSYGINNCYSANSDNNIPFAKIRVTDSVNYGENYTITNCYSTSNIASSSTVQNTYADMTGIVNALINENSPFIDDALEVNGGYPVLTFEVPPLSGVNIEKDGDKFTASVSLTNIKAIDEAVLIIAAYGNTDGVMQLYTLNNDTYTEGKNELSTDITVEGYTDTDYTIKAFVLHSFSNIVPYIPAVTYSAQAQ